jgi:hypothetical protein
VQQWSKSHAGYPFSLDNGLPRMCNKMQSVNFYLPLFIFHYLSAILTKLFT